MKIDEQWECKTLRMRIKLKVRTGGEKERHLRSQLVQKLESKSETEKKKEKKETESWIGGLETHKVTQTSPNPKAIDRALARSKYHTQLPKMDLDACWYCCCVLLCKKGTSSYHVMNVQESTACPKDCSTAVLLRVLFC